jgi:hypothetical protein
MKEYNCSRCDYSTSFKSDLKRHLTKKKPCISKNEQAPSIKELLNELYPIKDDIEKYTCKCGKEYSYQSGLSAHGKKCSVFQEDKELRMIVKDLQKDVKELKKKDKKNDRMITTTMNNNTMNNNMMNNSHNTMNNTIVVNNFGHEDISHLSPKFLEKCLFYMSMGVKSLTKAIHLDENKPENHTIKVTNLKSPFVKVMKDGKWVYKDKKEAISDLIWKENEILKSHYEENEIEMRQRWKEEKLEIVKAWLERLDNEDDELWKRLSQENLLLLVNNKEVILK